MCVCFAYEVVLGAVLRDGRLKSARVVVEQLVDSR